jgi:predicted AAA+ superfamily ATPase
LDEVQKAPALFDKIKFAYDERQIDFSVLLGSSRFLLLNKVKETLAGRVFVFELHSLMASELLTMTGRAPRMPLWDQLLQALIDGRSIGSTLQEQPNILLPDENEPRLQALDHLMAWGGMPELVSLDEPDRREWLRSYQETFLERDLPDIARLDDLAPFRRLERLAMARTAQLVEHSALASDAGISASTARRYLEYLRLAHQAFLLPPFSQNLTSQVVKTPKLYWVDLGLLLRGETPSLAFVGAAFETLVVTEAHKWINTSGRNVNLSFYRTRSGLEVDLIASHNDLLLAAEAKSRAKVVPSDFRSLRALAAATPPTYWRGGFVVYTGNTIECVDGARDLWAVPVHRLFT